MQPLPILIEEDFDDPDAVREDLRTILTTGSAPWDLAYEEGAFVMRNPSDPEAVQFFNIEVPFLEVDMRVFPGAGEAASGAGLIAGLDPERRTYLLAAFGRVADGRPGIVVLERLERGGYAVLASVPLAVAMPGSVRMSAEVRPDFVRFRFNEVSVFDAPRPGLPRFTGIVALGTGTFAFDDLTAAAAPGGR